MPDLEPLPDLEFDLTNVSKLRVLENEFDFEDLESRLDDGESEMAWGQEVHMTEYYFHQIP